MQTDLHRVIRTQQLTDDHCQVSLLPDARIALTDIFHPARTSIAIPEPMATHTYSTSSTKRFAR